MKIGIAVRTGGEALAASLAGLYAAAGKDVNILLLTEWEKVAKISTHIPLKTVDCDKFLYVDVLVADAAGLRAVDAACACVRTGLSVVCADDGDCRAAACLPACGGRVVSYGLNGKSCVTASSVDEERLLLCIQRAFAAVDGQMVERMEFPLRRRASAAAPRLLLAAASAALCGGLRAEDIAAFFASEDKNTTSQGISLGKREYAKPKH